MKAHTQVEVASLPTCDIHTMMGQSVAAEYDARTVFGSWANLCEECFQSHGLGLGLGIGQRLVVRPNVGTA